MIMLRGVDLRFRNNYWLAIKDICKQMGIQANAIVASNGLTHLGCMAHARRKFSDAVKAQGRKKKRGKALQGLALIQKIYRVENRQGN